MSRTGIMWITAMALAVTLCVGCWTSSSGYRQVNGGWVYTTWNEANGPTDRYLEGVDSKSLTVLSNKEYAKDANQVYLRGIVVHGAVPESFELLEFPYSRDASRAYCGTVPIETENVDTFRVIKGSMSTLQVSDGGRSIENIFGKLATVPRDVTVILASGWAHDDAHCYFGPTRLDDADPSSLVALDEDYAKDKRNVYFRTNVVVGADVQTFRMKNELFAEDRNRSYCLGEPVGQLKAGN